MLALWIQAAVAAAQADFFWLQGGSLILSLGTLIAALKAVFKMGELHARFTSIETRVGALERKIEHPERICRFGPDCRKEAGE